MHQQLIISVAFAVVFFFAPARGMADVVEIVNSVRSQGCAELPAVKRPLVPNAQLDAAARRMSRGEGLQPAISGSRYRARKSASVRIRTENGDSGVAQLLAQHFCDIVADRSLEDIGSFRRGDELWMVLAAPLSPPEGEDAAAAAERVLRLVNEARSQSRRCGRRQFDAAPPLSHAQALQRAARVHADDMARHSLLGHQGSDDSRPAERVSRAGYPWIAVAENVAGGQTTVEEVVATWLKSPGHCASLMDPRYSESGVARATNPDSEHVIYWVQVFAAPE